MSIKCLLQASIHKIDTIGIFQSFALLYVDCRPSLNTTCVVLLDDYIDETDNEEKNLVFHFKVH